MFRSFLSQGRKTFALANLKLNYCSKPRPPPEINQVTLVGTLINDAFIFQSGTKSLTVKTYDVLGEKYQVQNVYTKRFQDLKAGQRVHVSGKLRSVPIELENNIKRSQTSVVADRVFVLENSNENDNTAMNDINQIDIVANVASNVIKNNDGSFVFKLATHFERSTDDGLLSETYFHSVFVFDDDLKTACENVQIRDKVAIHGEIRCVTKILSNGKKKHHGFIVAKSIEKVRRLAQQVDHDDVDHEANN